MNKVFVSFSVEAAKSVCHHTLKKFPQFEDLWIVLINLAGKHSAGEQDSVHEVG